ncbi:hypothetical protein AB0C21_06305 [Spirillospora sp. NPDC049024]
MESDALPVWIPLGCALLSIGIFVQHRRLWSGKPSEKRKDFLFLSSQEGSKDGTVLGLRHLAAAFARSRELSDLRPSWR